MQLAVGVVIMVFYIICYCMFFNSNIMLGYMIYVLSYVIDINWMFFGLEEIKVTASRSVANAFVPLFYGENYDACILLMKIMLPSCIFVAIANVIRTQYLIPNKRDSVYIISVLGGAGINVISNILLIPVYGVKGAAIGLLLAEAYVCIYQMFKIRKELPIVTYIKNIRPYMLVGGMMYIVVASINITIENAYLYIVVKILIGLLVYIAPCGIIYVRQGRLLE